jgi:hypothetical protein
MLPRLQLGLAVFAQVPIDVQLVTYSPGALTADVESRFNLLKSGSAHPPKRAS